MVVARLPPTLDAFMNRSALLLSLFITCFVMCATAGASETEEATLESIQSRNDELERRQGEMLQRAKKQLEGLEDGPRREQLKRLLAEIERRMQEPRKLYLAPSSKMTAEMHAYHARMIRRIEDCGTRNFPKRQGKSIYGKGLVAVTLDRSGKALEIEILESSGEKLLDAHVAKLVRASSPFGDVPQRAILESSRPFDLIVVLTGFDFKHDDSPVEALDEKERCRWR